MNEHFFYCTILFIINLIPIRIHFNFNYQFWTCIWFHVFKKLKSLTIDSKTRCFKINLFIYYLFNVVYISYISIKIHQFIVMLQTSLLLVTKTYVIFPMMLLLKSQLHVRNLNSEKVKYSNCLEKPLNKQTVTYYMM